MRTIPPAFLQRRLDAGSIVQFADRTALKMSAACDDFVKAKDMINQMHTTAFAAAFATAFAAAAVAGGETVEQTNK